MTPGQELKSFTSKKGNAVVLRFVNTNDLDGLLSFINTLSLEDTYIMFSGEQLTREEETRYLSENLKGMEKDTRAIIVATVNETVIGSCSLIRRERRMSHVADLAISVSKEYRAEGIGKELLLATIETARNLKLRLLCLGVFANNPTALELYKKLGFTQYGLLPKAVQFKGEFVDKILMYQPLVKE